MIKPGNAAEWGKPNRADFFFSPCFLLKRREKETKLGGEVPSDHSGFVQRKQ